MINPFFKANMQQQGVAHDQEVPLEEKDHLFEEVVLDQEAEALGHLERVLSPEVDQDHL
jgi:hypothetical protein